MTSTTSKLLRIEVQGANVIVDGEDDSGTSKRLGVFPLSELQDVFARLGEPHETKQNDGQYVMFWKLDPVGKPIAKPRNVASGSGSFKPLPKSRVRD